MNYDSVVFVKQKTAYDVRISDWSSDVCSSDLLVLRDLPAHLEHIGAQRCRIAILPQHFGDDQPQLLAHRGRADKYARAGERHVLPGPGGLALVLDRQSVVSGKRVSVRVVLGCRRLII